MRKQGVTFIETLLVLMLLTFLLVIINPQSMEGMKKSVIQRAYFEELLSHLDYAKELAMVRNQQVTVRFHPGYQEVLFFLEDNSKHYHSIALPSSLKIFEDDIFNYYGDGGISNFKTVTFLDTTEGKKYYLAFQLGSGKFELK